MKTSLWVLTLVCSGFFLNACGGGSTTPPPPLATNFLVAAPTSATIGSSFSFTVTALDSAGNVVTSYAGTVVFSSTDTSAQLPPPSTLTGGNGTFSATLKTSGNESITATDTKTGTLSGVSNIIAVSGPATHFALGVPATATTRTQILITLEALDASNNPSSSYSGTVHFTSSDAKAILPPDTLVTGDEASLPVVLETTGNQTITVTDTAKSSVNGTSSAVNVAAAAPLVISSGALPNGAVGDGYNPHVVRVCVQSNCGQSMYETEDFFQLTAAGGVQQNGVNWSWAGAAGSSLPPGLTLTGARISGTPPVGSTGSYQVVVTVTDSGTPPVQTNQNYSITITLPPPPVVNAAQSQIRAVLNQPLSYTFTATANSLQQPLNWSETGALPAGLAFGSSGTLSGTPTQTGSFPISVTATDQFQQTSAAANFTIVVTVHGFVLTGSMATARRFHTATLLPNGKVLVAGGQNEVYAAVASAELYDPSSGTFSVTGNMTVPRAGHTATLLNNGQVLIAGGNSGEGGGAALSSAELYDPATGTFTATSGSMTAARASHTATLLQSGKVLIAGGDVTFYIASGQSLASAETFDPSTDTFTATGSMTVPRESHTATLLSSGKVLITGGSDGILGYTPTVTLYASSETFDPSTGQFTAAGMMSTQRDWQTASLLNSGNVLVAGGDSASQTEATADLFDPSSGSFAATGSMTEPRFYHDASTLNDGTVLISGGEENGSGAKATAEIYNPSAGTFAATGSMNAARVWHTSTVLQNGKVLITGGSDSVPMATAELYE